MNNEIVSSYRIMKIMYQRNYVTEVRVCISIFLIFFRYFRGFKYINCFFDTLPCLIVAGRVKFHFWTNLPPELDWKKIPLLGIQTNLTNATLPLDTPLLLGTQGQALVCTQSIWLLSENSQTLSRRPKVSVVPKFFKILCTFKDTNPENGLAFKVPPYYASPTEHQFVFETSKIFVFNCLSYQSSRSTFY